MTPREELQRSLKQMNLDWKVKMIDPKMACFRNAMSDVDRSLRILDIQYRNFSPELDEALKQLAIAYENVVIATKKSVKDELQINDITNTINPDFAFVSNCSGSCLGTATVSDFSATVREDGVHLDISIKHM